MKDRNMDEDVTADTMDANNTVTDDLDHKRADARDRQRRCRAARKARAAKVEVAIEAKVDTPVEVVDDEIDEDGDEFAGMPPPHAPAWMHIAWKRSGRASISPPDKTKIVDLGDRFRDLTPSARQAIATMLRPVLPHRRDEVLDDVEARLAAIGDWLAADLTNAIAAAIHAVKTSDRPHPDRRVAGLSTPTLRKPAVEPFEIEAEA
jgi:hypothetical protein